MVDKMQKDRKAYIIQILVSVAIVAIALIFAIVTKNLYYSIAFCCVGTWVFFKGIFGLIRAS
jgi:hypothetical protein